MDNSRRIRNTLLLLLVIGLIFVPRPVRADAAPPRQALGSDLVPRGEVTNVRMTAETVIISLLRSYPEASQGQAAVQATFALRNMGPGTESMEVGFPLAWGDGYSGYSEVADFRVRVNDKQVSFEREMAPNEFDWYSEGQALPWAIFSVTFPPGKNVLLQVNYTLNGTGYDAAPDVEFGYVLQTGAGWYGTIGSADVIVSLPYEANALNVILEYTAQGVYSNPVIAGNEIRWRFEDFEPDESYNLNLDVVKVDTWLRVVYETGNLQNNPEDGAAWGRLAEAYKKALGADAGCKFMRMDQASEELYRLAGEAYSKSTSLPPGDAYVHAGYAELLATHYFCAQGPEEELLLALQVLWQAMQIDPENEKALEVAGWISSWKPGYLEWTESGYVFLGLTATPAPSLTPAPTSTSQPLSTPSKTPTVVPTLAITPSPVPSPELPQPASPSICGAVLLPVILFLLWVRNRLIRS